MNIFLIGQFEGSMVRKIEWRAVFVICLIAGIFETISMTSGYLLTRIPFFFRKRVRGSEGFLLFRRRDPVSADRCLYDLQGAAPRAGPGKASYDRLPEDPSGGRDGVCVYLHGRDRLGVYRP